MIPVVLEAFDRGWWCCAKGYATHPPMIGRRFRLDDGYSTPAVTSIGPAGDGTFTVRGGGRYRVTVSDSGLRKIRQHAKRGRA